VDPTTNRITPGLQVSYDNNGNMTQGGYLGYDVANRMKSAIVEGGTIYYGYDSANRRIYYRSTSNAETIYLYGADGKKLGIYTVSSVTNTAIQFTQQSTKVYFAGRLLGASVDRLGSVRYGGASGVGYQAQYPYGVEYTTTVNDRQKYATYTRDSLTGLDYAMNRYYSSLWGRFLSPDPHQANMGGAGDPGSWNRYAYAGNDPVNANDPSGLISCLVFADTTWSPFPDWGEGAFGWGWAYSGIYFCPGFVPGFGGGGGGGGGGAGLYAIDALALTTYAHQFAQALLSENFSSDCAADIVSLGITPEQWAGALDNVSVLNGIGSQVSLASTLPNGSAAQQKAQSGGFTVGQTFSSDPGQVALASVNGPQVWINPSMVNPGNTQADFGLIAHETLHNLGLIDPTIQQDLGIPVTNNTVNIANKLQQDCFPGPPGNIMPSPGPSANVIP